MKAFYFPFAFIDFSSNLEYKLFFCHLIKLPRDTIQSFFRVAASNIDTLKSDDLHGKLDVDGDDK